MNKKMKDAMHKYMTELYKQEGHVPPPLDTMKSHVKKEHVPLLGDAKLHSATKKPRRR